ncbi:hypothetical protein PPSIR1_21294 [Plesiocystis pacifica SIR-1]|uniref:Immunity MXAN-0049 protein domain-containing protein n=1 Tax=Plesiocystis pacifica SIR-1 TaxID=391625 RepID=A6G3J8_9BACT|nr:DUF1629 domain-containing protein [Plesiocystis pacifica]EDM79605.1 hypothetical protein PPSIR1_21294 [Plesiocystis pacifica SIR-1]
MRSIYELESDVGNFQAYVHASESDLEVMMAVRGLPLITEWSPPRVVRSDEPGPRSDCPSLFGTSSPCLSKRALDILGDVLLARGEALPVDCEDEPLFIYNCTRFADVLDVERSGVEWGEGGQSPQDESDNILWVERIVWKPEAYTETVFRIPRIQHSPTFISSEVRQAIEASGLQGFLFEELEGL